MKPKIQQIYTVNRFIRDLLKISGFFTPSKAWTKAQKAHSKFKLATK
jgi:hypothetical protein